MEFQTKYVARSYGEYRNEVDFDIEETGDSEQEVVDLVAARLTESYCYLNGITVRSYRVVEIDGEFFRSEPSDYKVFSSGAVALLPAYIAAKKEKDDAIKAGEQAAKRAVEAQLKAERLKVYEEVKRELEKEI